MKNLACVFFDRVMSPTYHFGGLSYGNLHSMTNESYISYPRKAALQSLDKMNLIRSYGFDQYVFPPQLRDYLSVLNNMGFSGDMSSVLNAVLKEDIHLMSSIFSGSASWVANSFVLTSSCDSIDEKVHITPANLVSCFHRQLEVMDTIENLKDLFMNRTHFNLHQCAPASFSDEGAANMIRLSNKFNKGLYLFVYGKVAAVTPKIDFPVRQSKEAFEYLIRHHKLRSDQYMLIQQSAESIEQGVFHNDVISFGTDNCLVLHENSFKNQADVLKKLSDQYAKLFKKPLIVVEISEKTLSLKQAVKTYFFNSQCVLLDQNRLLLICPNTCKGHPAVQSCIARFKDLIDKELIIEYVDLTESLKNGGGPACLRGFAFLNDQEKKLLNHNYLLTEKRYLHLKEFIL